MSRSQHSFCHSRSRATRRSGRIQDFPAEALCHFAFDLVSVVAGRIGHRARIGRIVALDGRAPIPARGRNGTRRPPYFNWGAERRSRCLPLRWLANPLAACRRAIFAWLTSTRPAGRLLGRVLRTFRRRGRHLRRRLGARKRLAALAAGQPNVINRMLDAVQAGARGEHPTRKDPLVLVGGIDLVHLDESGRLRGLRRGARVTGTFGNLERTELHGFAGRRLKGNRAPGDLVQSGKDRDRMLILSAWPRRGSSMSKRQGSRPNVPIGLDRLASKLPSLTITIRRPHRNENFGRGHRDIKAAILRLPSCPAFPRLRGTCLTRRESATKARAPLPSRCPGSRAQLERGN